jgi:hypothetical protein
MLAVATAYTTLPAVLVLPKTCLQETCANCKLHVLLLHAAGMVSWCRVIHCVMSVRCLAAAQKAAAQLKKAAQAVFLLLQTGSNQLLLARIVSSQQLCHTVCADATVTQQLALRLLAAGSQPQD